MSAPPEYAPLSADPGLFGAAARTGWGSSRLTGEPPLDPEDGPDTDDGMTRAGMERAENRRRLAALGAELIRQDWERAKGEESAA